MTEEKKNPAGENPGMTSAEEKAREAEAEEKDEVLPDREENAPDEGDAEAAPVDEKDEKDDGGRRGRRGEIKKLKKELEELRASLDAEKKRAAEAEDQKLRIAAEYDNFRKRSQTERAGIYAGAVSDTLSGLLPVIDNLQIAAKYSGGDAEKMAEGLTMILSKLPETLEKLGITPFGEPGETFDPELHNAVMHVEDESFGEGEIVEVLQQGYKYGDKILRYAMVKTAN